MEASSGITLSGRLLVLDQAGRILVDKKNLEVTAGKKVLRDALAGDLVPALSAIAVGTGATAPALTDTGLAAELMRSGLTSVEKSSSGASVSADMYLSASQANDNTLTEAGLFIAGILLSRVTFPGIVKTNALALTFRWVVTIV